MDDDERVIKEGGESMTMHVHSWPGQGQYCTCGQDTVTCQQCGQLECGELVQRVLGRNVHKTCAEAFVAQQIRDGLIRR